jgi:hypothetical protein
MKKSLLELLYSHKKNAGINLPNPTGIIDDATTWDEDEETEEVFTTTAVFQIPEELRFADPFDDVEYLPITEINLFEEKQVAEELSYLEEVIDIAPVTPEYKHHFATHQKELHRLSIFCVSLFTLGLLPYTSTALADYRPWVRGEQAPLVGLWYTEELITEANDGSLIAISLPEEEVEVELTAIKEGIQEQQELQALDDIAASQYFDPLVPRSPAVPVDLFIPEGALDDYFTQLALIEDGSQKNVIARALVWGDSTIANDGIIKNVRKRMQTRFGDAGPGFLAAQVDPRWAVRRDIVRKPKGDWSTKTIVFGGGSDGRYGLAGTVSTASPGSQVTLGGVKEEGVRQSLNRFQVFYQKQPDGGDLNISTQSKTTTVHTDSKEYADGFYNFYVKHGDPYLYLSVNETPVTIYGVALEKNNPGVTWETFGVAGSSVASMQKQQLSHIQGQVRARDPSLVVYWTGGNELGYPSVRSKSGKVYKRIYRKVLRQLKEGAPEASCLLIGPLDQATKERGEIISKPTLDNIIHFQREVAKEEGCAFWDAREVMGGKNSFTKWLHHSPALASPDLAHLTGRGRHLIGETLADVIMRNYEIWRLKNPDIYWEPPESVREASFDSYLWECEQLAIEDVESTENICRL